MILSHGDLNETMETASWDLKLRGRVEKPNELAGFSVTLSRVPVRVSETERAVAEELSQSLSALEAQGGQFCSPNHNRCFYAIVRHCG